MEDIFKTEDGLDALIENALQGERMLAAPINLHRRIDERVRIIALKDKERARFRYTMMTFGLTLITAIMIAIGIVSFTNLGDIMTHGISGGRGQYDSMAAYAEVSFTNYSGAYSMIMSMTLAAGTLLLGLFPLRRYMTLHR